MITFREFLELAESSTPERGKRKLALRGLDKHKHWRNRQRSETSDKAALKKAGFRRSASNDHYSTDSQDSSSKHHDTSVATYKNQSDYAKDSLPLKKSFGKKVRKTADRVRQIKAIRKQIGGDRTPRQVHDVSIHSKEDEKRKNDPENLISRGKSFKQEVRAVPKALKNAGAKPGDIVTSTPSGIMPGENRKEGAKKRDKIYTKELGAKMNPKTGKTTGRVRG